MKRTTAFAIIAIAAVLNTLTVTYASKCRSLSPAVLMMIFQHCFLHCFTLYGFLFDEPELLVAYLVTPIVVVVLWQVFDKSSKHHSSSNCILIQEIDASCQMSAGSTTGFTDVFRSIGVPDVPGLGTNWAYVIIMGFGWCIALLKLYRSYTTKTKCRTRF